MTTESEHFSTHANGVPTAPGRFLRVEDTPPVEFLPGLTFQPVLGEAVLANFVHFQPGAQAPRHVHEEEQMVIVQSGELYFEIDGVTRVLREGDVAVVPPWVSHSAWTTEVECREIDIFTPPRKTLLALIPDDSGA
jgi:quercetin dioxygenase-like cupin family protein